MENNNNEVFEEYVYEEKEPVIEENKIFAAAKRFLDSPINKAALVTAGALALLSLTYKSGKKAGTKETQTDSYNEGYQYGFNEGYESAESLFEEESLEDEEINIERGIELGIKAFKAALEAKGGE